MQETCSSFYAAILTLCVLVMHLWSYGSVELYVSYRLYVSGMLMRPEYHEAEARKCEAEAKKILRGRGHEASHYNAATFYNYI